MCTGCMDDEGFSLIGTGNACGCKCDASKIEAANISKERGRKIGVCKSCGHRIVVT